MKNEKIRDRRSSAKAKGVTAAAAICLIAVGAAAWVGTAAKNRAAVDGVLDEGDAAAFEAGIVLSDGTVCLPARLDIIRPSVCNVTVYEGKYHQVKRMLASRGKHVTALHRFKIGALELDSALKPGMWREMDADEAALVFENVR